MITRRILGVLRRRLQDNHCGGLSNKGTDTALIQLINLLEDLEDVNGAADHEVSDTPLDFMSWDTAKAFDLVGNHVQYAAWRRMGVPVNIASWLMNLDLGGSFVIMMPQSRKTLDAIRMSGPQDTSPPHRGGEEPRKKRSASSLQRGREGQSEPRPEDNPQGEDSLARRQESAWNIAADVHRQPRSTVETHTQYIGGQREARRTHGNIKPPLAVLDTRINQHTRESRKEGPPVKRREDKESNGLYAARSCARGLTLLVPVGRIVTKRDARREDPEGRGYLKCTGGWLQVSTQPFDMIMVPTPAPIRLDGGGGRYQNLTPYLQYARVEGQGNCR
jgi:hypothetical protein